MGSSPRSSFSSNKSKSKENSKDHFKQMLKKQNIKQFEIEVIGEVSQSFVQAILPAMQSTTNALFQDQIVPETVKLDSDSINPLESLT